MDIKRLVSIYHFFALFFLMTATYKHRVLNEAIYHRHWMTAFIAVLLVATVKSLLTRDKESSNVVRLLQVVSK